MSMLGALSPMNLRSPCAAVCGPLTHNCELWASWTPSSSSAPCFYRGLCSTALSCSYHLLSCLCSRDTWSVEQRRVLGIRAGLQFMTGDYQAVKQSSIVVMLSVGSFQMAAAHITPAAFPFNVTTFLSSPQNPVVLGSSSPDLPLCLILQIMC